MQGATSRLLNYTASAEHHFPITPLLSPFSEFLFRDRPIFRGYEGGSASVQCLMTG